MANHISLLFFVDAVADIVHDVESRIKWDKLFPIIEVLESYEKHRIVYW